jgi:hypothetical protein
LIGGAGVRAQAATALVRALPRKRARLLLKERCARKERCAYVPGKI